MVEKTNQTGNSASVQFDTTSTGKQHFEVLDGLRGSAAFLVVLFHIMLRMAFAFDPPTNFLPHAILAVDLFFVLSGFVVAHAYDDRWNSMSIREFLVTRLIRLHPLVILGVLLGLASYLFDPFAGSEQNATWSALLTTLALALLLLPNAPLPNRPEDTHSLNGPMWSLLQEYIANIAYAFILRRLSTRTLAVVAITAGLLLISAAIYLDTLDVGWNWDSMWMAPIRLTFSFVTGLWLYRVRNRLPQPKIGFLLLTVILVIAFIMPIIPKINGISMNGLYEAAIVVVLFPFIIIAGAHSETGTGLLGICKMAGRISYPLYITHFPFLWVYYNLVQTETVSVKVVLYAGVALLPIVMLAAWIAVKYWDEPIRTYLHSWQRRSNSSTNKSAKIVQARFNPSRYLLAILVLGGLLRLAHLMALRSTLWFDNLDLDPAYYDAWAQRIAAGDWLGSRPFFVDPFYAYFLGALYALFGHSLLVVRLAQVGIGLGTIILVFVLGRKVGGRSIGYIAACAYAIYGPAIFNEIEIEKTALATFFLLAAVTLVLWKNSKAAFFGGVVLALAVLCRGNMLALVVPLGLYLLERKPRWNARGMLLFFAGCSLVLLPVLWRNHQVGGGYVLTTSIGQNLYQGNNPYNTGGSYGNLPFVRNSPEFEEVDYRAEAETRVGKDLTPGQVSNYWAAEAWQHMLSRPSFAAQMIWRKLELVLNDYEVPDNSDYYFLARYSPVLRWTPLSFGWLLPFAALGILCSWRQRESRLIAAVLLIYIATIVAFFVVGRFRLPAVPLLVIYAALGLEWLVRQVREPKRQRVVLVLAAVWLVLCIPFTFQELPFQDRQVSVATNWRNLGSMQARLGRFNAAAGSYERALALQPDSDLLTSEVALVYLKLGRLADAERALVRTTELNPNLIDSWVTLGQLYADTDRPQLAVVAFQRAVALDPTNATLRSHLDSLLNS